MDLTVREAQPDHAQAMVDILNPIIEAGTYTVLDTPLTIQTQRQYIVDFPQRGVFHVAIRCQDRKVVGFQSMEPLATFTHAFDHVGTMATFVDLSCRRQGVGRRLFAATFEAARAKAYKKVFTYVRADNPAALACYLDHGFEVVGTAKKHAKVKGAYIDEIIIERLL